MPVEPKAFTWEVALPEITYLLCMHIWFWFVLIFVIEYNRQIFSCCYKKNDLWIKEVKDSQDEGKLIEDEDVIEEENSVKNSNEFAIKVENLWKIYPIETEKGWCSKGRNISYKVAVKNLTFGVKQGDCFCLLGTNGAGKTTAFKILSGEILPTNGRAYIAGRDVTTELQKIRHMVGYCPQFDAILEN